MAGDAAPDVLVFDAGAIIAYLDSEQGGELVRDLLGNHAGVCMMHAANTCEVLYHAHRVRGERDAASSDRSCVMSESWFGKIWTKRFKTPPPG